MINTEKYLMPRNKANKKCLRYLEKTRTFHREELKKI